MYRPVLRTPILNIDTQMNEIRIANFKNTFNNRVSVQCTSINRFDFLPPPFPVFVHILLKKVID